jgi:hypothetical protein
VKKLIVLTVLLLGPEMTQQAPACDMAAIESWVSTTCNGNRCAAHPTAEQRHQGCDDSNCTKFQLAASKIGCAGSDCRLWRPMRWSDGLGAQYCRIPVHALFYSPPLGG